jgi:hypothetical protein
VGSSIHYSEQYFSNENALRSVTACGSSLNISRFREPSWVLFCTLAKQARGGEQEEEEQEQEQEHEAVVIAPRT